jgi:hypothetical protein
VVKSIEVQTSESGKKNVKVCILQIKRRRKKATTLNCP